MTKHQWFYSDGTLFVERYTLKKDGFPDVKIRRIYDDWEMLTNVSANADEHWVKINLTEEQIQDNIKKYA
jgi:hypothetical protein